MPSLATSSFWPDEDFGADFFDQFLDFSPVQNDHSTEKQIVNSSSDNASSSTLGVLQNWPGESWMFDQEMSSLSHGQNFYFEMTGRAAISDSELLSLEGISLVSPKVEPITVHSLPASPSPVTATQSKKVRAVESMSKKIKKSMNSFGKALRSPIRKNPPPRTSRTKSLVLEENIDPLNYEFDFEKIPASASTKPENLADDVDLSFETPLSTPQLEASSRKTSGQRRSIDGPPATPRQDHLVNRCSKVPFPADMHTYTANAEAPIWWNHASSAPMAQPSPTQLHINPQRATKSLAHQLHNDLARSANERGFAPLTIPPRGLMIQVPPNQIKSFVVQSTSRRQQPQNDFGPAHPNCQTRVFSHTHSQSRTRLPGHYPPHGTRHNPQATSESESPSPKSYSVRKRKTPRKERSNVPRTPNVETSVDFVNFTPSDSKKILTGVAPSGSSKTKARREKEAMERRRKLSQAAVNAVRAAGGNVESLVEQGLLY